MIKTLLLAAIVWLQAAPQTGVTVSGQVIREDKQTNPTNANQIRLTGPATSIVTMGGDGTFEFKNITPGTYQAVIGPLVAMPPVTIVVGNTDITGYKLVVPIVVSVPGTLSVENDGLRPRFPLTFTPATGSPVIVSAGQTFTAPLPKGEYRVTASAIPAGYTLKSMTSGAIDLRVQPLRIAEGDSPRIAIEMSVASPPPWVRFSGKVTGQGPATGLSLTGGTVGQPLTTTFGADGSFEFPKMLPGTYTGRLSPLTTANVSMVINVSIGDKDLINAAIAVPSNKDVTGRVSVEGGGPLPRLIALSAASPGSTSPTGTTNPAPGTITVTSTNSSTSAAVQPDGTFKFSLPTGDRQISMVPSSIPPGYIVKSMTYGSTDLLKNPIRIAPDDSALITVIFNTTGVTLLQVSGKLIGMNPSLLSGNVSLVGASSTLPALETSIGADGSFVFPKVIAGTYTARLNAPGIPTTAAASVVIVGNKDISGVEISVPRDVNGRIVVEGDGPAPRITLPLTATGTGTGTSSISIAPQIDGSFRASLPLGERRVGKPSGLPAGYSIKSIKYGTTDLLTDPLKITEADSAELTIVLGTSTPVPWVSVSGKVNGLTNPLGVRLVLTGTPLGSPLEAPLGADGSFSFSRILPGSYLARVSLSGLQQISAPLSVTNKDVTGFAISVPPGYAIAGQVLVEGAPVGFASPVVVLEARSSTGAITASTGSSVGKPFLFRLEPGSYDISTRTVPAGYQVKSVIYGTTDLMKEPLKIDGPIPWEIIVRLTR
ncbi:MAG TPA: hypothetical protein VK210_07135 [Terriglobia bacterium]|nr:hypothetical protein [Terriglobia bacterium]